MFNKVFYNKLSRIISISNETTKSLIASGSNRNKIELIYHGIKDNDLVSPDNNINDIIFNHITFNYYNGKELIAGNLGQLNKL